jgi:hypothetical protein
MYPRVHGVISQEGVELSTVINVASDRYSIPPQLLTACGIAESDLSAQAAREKTWPDVSYSVWQQTVKYAADYGLGDGANTPTNRALVRQVLSSDLARAADIAARQLGHWWAQEGDPIRALCRYNRPGGDPATNPNRANYERGWAASSRYVSQEDGMPEHSFQYGFADLAEALGADVVGEPTTDEFPLGDGAESGQGATMQVTTRGAMLYASGGPPVFLAGEQA